MFKLDLEKAEEPEIKLPTYCGSYKKARELKKKNIYFCFIAKTFGCVYHNKLWKILKEMGISDHLNLPPEKPVCRTRSNSYNWTWNNGLVTNWERNSQSCILSPCLFNLYAEYIMRNAGLDNAQNSPSQASTLCES